jgi:hypothetical protein
VKHSERLQAFRARQAGLTLQESEDIARAVQICKRVEDGADQGFHVANVVSHRTGEAKLDVTWLGVVTQLEAVKAREIAWMLLEATAVAEAEASLVRFLHEKVEMPIEAAAGMLNEFRGYRKADPQSLVDHKGTH